MLEIANLNVSHDHLQVVWNLSLSVKKGEIVTLIGPNGSGKTSTVETIVGLNRNATGTIRFLGKDILGLPSHRIFKEGLALVPERREIFPKMSVFENLILGSAGKEDVREKMLSLVFSLFPVLSEREKQQAGTMSGGEQQMLAIARALMSDPKMLVLDEPSTGLSPLMVAQVFRSLEQLGRGGLTILLLEQNVRNALDLCNRGYVLENGRVVLEGKSKELMHNPHIQKAYLGF
jgi:branched-chain amino acid transport system ATP-binding protein